MTDTPELTIGLTSDELDEWNRLYQRCPPFAAQGIRGWHKKWCEGDVEAGKKAIQILRDMYRLGMLYPEEQ